MTVLKVTLTFEVDLLLEKDVKKDVLSLSALHLTPHSAVIASRGD